MVILFWNVVPYIFIFLSFVSVGGGEEEQKQGSLRSAHNCISGTSVIQCRSYAAVELPVCLFQ